MTDKWICPKEAAWEMGMSVNLFKERFCNLHAPQVVLLENGQVGPGRRYKVLASDLQRLIDSMTNRPKVP